MFSVKSLLTAAFVLTGAIAGSNSALADNQLPDGWKYPFQSKRSDANPARDDSLMAQPRVRADFDGDGTVDSALLLKSTEFTGQGLLVNLSSVPGDGWLVLDEINWGEQYPSVALVMNIGVRGAGTFKVDCERAEPECQPGEPMEITVDKPVLLYSRSADASSVFHWDEETRSFQRIWLSE